MHILAPGSCTCSFLISASNAWILELNTISC
jgi:hypothetical protein